MHRETVHNKTKHNRAENGGIVARVQAKANLQRAVLTGTDLTSAKMAEADLSGAQGLERTVAYFEGECAS